MSTYNIKQIFKNSYYLIALIIANTLFGQDGISFQQRVDYQIDVSLNVKDHSLHGSLQMVYHNRSNDTLSYIMMHLWPNAYKHQQTPFAKQLLELDRYDFHFANKKQRGYIDSLAFRVNGQPVIEQNTFEQPDITKLVLNKPLYPGDSIQIATGFRVKIPSDFSRFAYKDDTYMICQWYPKPAVYDKEGWHPMSYLDQGEFYSEFGSFNVRIRIPESYQLGASGIELSKRKIDSSMIEYVYQAKNVHDFAWFAGKEHWIGKKKIQIDGRSVELRVVYKEENEETWKYALKMMQRALEFYSEEVGPYPYPAMTACDFQYKGSNMEYPMLTVMGEFGDISIFDNVLCHEIGHNWFYGILATNERTYPWLDEGLNTFYDVKYSKKYYGYDLDQEYISNKYYAAQFGSKPINTPSDQLSEIGYYVCAYGKPTMAFTYLESYLGKDIFKKAIQQYFSTWKFRHPYPMDLKNAFEQTTDKKLGWFFDHLVQTSENIDFSLHKGCCDPNRKNKIRIQNNTSFDAPVPVTFINKDKKEQRIFELGAKSDTIIYVELYEKAIIDEKNEIPETNRNNNTIQIRPKTKVGKPIKLAFLADFKDLTAPRINLLPAIGYNQNDGLMIGASAYNLPFFNPPIEYRGMAMFSFASLTAVGMGDITYNIYKDHQQIQIGAAFKSFSKRFKEATEDRPYSFSERFTKSSIFGSYLIKADKNMHRMYLSNALITEERGLEQRIMTATDTFWNYSGNEVNLRTVHRLGYSYDRSDALFPFRATIQLEYANYEDFGDIEHYVKLTAEAWSSFYYQPNWSVDVRFFGGVFLYNSDIDFGDMPLRMVSNNRNDYHYDSHIVGRRAYEGFSAHQVDIREGGFKTALEPIIDDGSSNAWLFSLNIVSDIPIKLPIRTPYLKVKPYLDIGYFKNTAPSVTVSSIADEIMVNAGFKIEVFKGLLAIYFPLLSDEMLDNKIRSFSKNVFLNRITFSVDLGQINKQKIVELLNF